MESPLPPSPPTSPRSHRESVDVTVEDMMHPLEERVFQLSQELTQTDASGPALSTDEIITKLNIIAEMLEEVETTFRKERSSPYRRDGKTVAFLVFLATIYANSWGEGAFLESNLSDQSNTRVKAATLSVNSRAIERMLDVDDEMLDRVCAFATDADPALRCYATGLLSVGLRDRSIADTVVNNDTPLKFLKRARMYATKLEKERQQAVRYIQKHVRLTNARVKKSHQYRYPRVNERSKCPTSPQTEIFGHWDAHTRSRK
ncbi:hypothetical protein PsorP6_000358 [Peronosclerospora sorghi]|uniref:Uncharacterized protein n=1 Tax=Peronosclerospora sorghi TaxID=230839 RepID=A0ACC0WWH0_9STRA|nr:hypothetical protein PsorP6_000358 [Peronosclerospora sorghi]